MEPERRGSIPADEFFGDRPASSRPYAVADEETGTEFEVTAPPPAPPRPEVAATEFFRREPPPADRPLARWAARPLRHGAVAFSVGFVGTLVLSSNILTQIVLGAPIFEEFWKFGAALLLVAALRIESGPIRLVVALLPGVGFGVMEHFLTYAEEPLWLLASRIVFHSGATAVSMATYHALVPVWDVRLRWAATLPATVLHWANNFAAVVLGLASVVAGDPVTVAAIAVTSTIAVTAHLLAWSILAGARRVRGWTLRLWVRHAPEDLRS